MLRDRSGRSRLHPGKVVQVPFSAIGFSLFSAHITIMSDFDYHAPAELFGTAGGRARRQTMAYRRFESGAMAVRFAIETLPPALLAGAVLESDEQRFDHRAIRALYDSADYPLARP